MTSIDFSELKRLLEIVREHELSELELEREGFRIRIKKGEGVQAPGASPVPIPADAGVGPAPHAAIAAAPSRPPADESPQLDGIDLAVVKSPIVGTFFRAPEPGARAFVEIGDPVKKGQVLCIIEAMKLMNEIDSEHDGEIVSIYVENGQPVQYGERLFAIRARVE